ncbi:procathepsin L-like [Mytilus edulis]|uniref:procathepsin L-like n=1 Tax=Mytilus edulis TaxID=6550 RepID=UPI0039F0033E
MLRLCILLVAIATVFTAPQAQDQNSIIRYFDIQPASVKMTVTAPKGHVVTSFEPYDKSWEKFKLEHSKSYHTIEEETYRRTVFKKNALKIEEHNKQYSLGQKSYYLGINQFADLEHWEYMQHHGFQVKKTVNRTSTGSKFLPPLNAVLPENVDWRDKGYVTPVKNQGQCGSCWSFSTTGALEGQHFRKSGKLLSLSEQQLVDCSGDYGNEGCNGGLMDDAFKYIKAVGGLETEDDYPYTAKQHKCDFDASETVASDTGFVDVESGSESDLKKASASVGPISVAIDASHQSFQLYKGGVYDEEECSSKNLDHGVLCIGYGTDDSGNDYWLVKNSWGETWGDQGYVKMTRNKDNQCGIATQASYPLV